MSKADDILFAPIVTQQSWRKLTQDIVDYMDVIGTDTQGRYQIIRSRPKGSLLLMELMESFHMGGQTEFYIVSGPGKHEFEVLRFHGVLYFGRYENRGEHPALMNATGYSIRDLNLYPNTYNHTYVFGNKFLALAYQTQGSF